MLNYIFNYANPEEKKKLLLTYIQDLWSQIFVMLLKKISRFELTEVFNIF